MAKLLAWQWAAFCTDGELDGKHPRGYGTFTRILGRYVREQHIMPLEEAIRKATSLAAENVGIKDRGRDQRGQLRGSRALRSGRR